MSIGEFHSGHVTEESLNDLTCRVGPILGALMASGYYALNRASKYWEANPGQDSRGVQLE